MLGACGSRRTAQRDRNRNGLVRADVVTPYPEIALEHDRLAVGRYRRPDHAAIGERRQLPCSRVWRCGLLPEIRCAAPVRHEVDGRAVSAPHRPAALRAHRNDRCIGRRPVYIVNEIDLALVQMAVTLPPPLPARNAARRDRECAAVWRWCTPEF